MQGYDFEKYRDVFQALINAALSEVQVLTSELRTVNAELRKVNAKVNLYNTIVDNKDISVLATHGRMLFDEITPDIEVDFQVLNAFRGLDALSQSNIDIYYDRLMSSIDIESMKTLQVELDAKVKELNDKISELSIYSTDTYSLDTIRGLIERHNLPNAALLYPIYKSLPNYRPQKKVKEEVKEESVEEKTKFSEITNKQRFEIAKKTYNDLKNKYADLLNKYYIIKTQISPEEASIVSMYTNINDIDDSLESVYPNITAKIMYELILGLMKEIEYSINEINGMGEDIDKDFLVYLNLNMDELAVYFDALTKNDKAKEVKVSGDVEEVEENNNVFFLLDDDGNILLPDGPDRSLLQLYESVSHKSADTIVGGAKGQSDTRVDLKSYIGVVPLLKSTKGNNRISYVPLNGGEDVLIIACLLKSPKGEQFPEVERIVMKNAKMIKEQVELIRKHDPEYMEKQRKAKEALSPNGPSLKL